MRSGASSPMERRSRSSRERKSERLARFCHLNGMTPDLTTSSRFDFRIPSEPAPPPSKEPNPPENPDVPIREPDPEEPGRPDIFFTNGASIVTLKKDSPKYRNRLLRNEGQGTFADVTEQAGLAG